MAVREYRERIDIAQLTNDDLPEDPVRNDGIHDGPEDGLRFRDIICEQYFRL